MLPNAQEMLTAVSHRVTSMLQGATKASESQVNAEIRRLEAGFAALHSKVVRVEQLLSSQDQSVRWRQQDNLSKVLADVEQRWETEIKAVKRELHQTILAHNHNADLMADHKAAIDKIRAEIDEKPLIQTSETQQQQLQEQLERLAKTLEHNRVQEQDIDTLLRRGEVLMHRLGSMGVVA